MDNIFEETKIRIPRHEAIEMLKKYPEENVAYVKECLNDVTACLACYLHKREEVPAGKISTIVKHYILEAEDEGIMDWEEFETILDLLDTAGQFDE